MNKQHLFYHEVLTVFDELYKVGYNEKEVFGENWVGPDVYPHGEETLIANYPANDDSDGQSVSVYCTALPACFYKIVAHEGKDSIGDTQMPWKLSTGSGREMAKLAATLAKAISEGMIGIEE